MLKFFFIDSLASRSRSLSDSLMVSQTASYVSQTLIKYLETFTRFFLERIFVLIFMLLLFNQHQEFDLNMKMSMTMVAQIGRTMVIHSSKWGYTFASELRVNCRNTNTNTSTLLCQNYMSNVMVTFKYRHDICKNR